MTEKEDSIVFKIHEAPKIPKFLCAILSLIQLQIYGSTNESPTFTVLVNILTFLASCLTIGLIVGKKTENFANFCLFKCVTQKKEINWNEFYYTYATVFCVLNLLAIVASANYRGGQGFASTLGFIVMIVYFIDGLQAFNKIDTSHVDEPSTPGCYARFLKLIGSFPKIIRLLILILNVVLIALLANRIGCYVYYSPSPYYYHSNEEHVDCGNDEDMMIFIAIISIAVSALDIILCYDILYWYYAYATAFGSFNLLAIIASVTYFRGDSLTSIFGLIVTILYYADGYYAFGKIDTIHVNESSTPGCYARFLNLIGSFPKIMRLLVVTLNVALIVLLASGIGCYYYNNNYYNYNRNYYDCGNSDDLYMMGIIVAMSIIFSILDGFILRIKNFKVGIAKRLMLTITTMSFSMCGFFVCLNNADRRIPMTIITFVTFLLTFFMTIAESYVKSNEPIMETNNRTILPSNLAKNIINPVVPDTLKIQINQEIDPSKLTNDTRPLLQ
uniref:Uncharacterized protein n=1 Tax=Acrobeloides nanus TaxID=290746 RepID=A0A914C7W8_9BILA